MDTLRPLDILVMFPLLMKWDTIVLALSDPEIFHTTPFAERVDVWLFVRSISDSQAVMKALTSNNSWSVAQLINYCQVLSRQFHPEVGVIAGPKLRT